MARLKAGSAAARAVNFLTASDFSLSLRPSGTELVFRATNRESRPSLIYWTSLEHRSQLCLSWFLIWLNY